MRRTILSLLLTAMALTGIAQTIGEAFYIYRNDGGFNAFFRDEVQSIEYSNYDAEGNYYDELVTQIVNTRDSIYQIPLAAIDSVGFVTPKTVYKPGIINLQDGLQSYVVKVDGDVITFSSSVPSNLLPHVGDKIVTTDMNDFFPVGYAGEVLDIRTIADGIEITCGDVALEDVFECFYGFTQTSVQAESRRRAWWNDLWDWAVDHMPDGVYQGSVPYEPEPFHRDLTLGMPTGVDINIGNWAVSYQSRMELDFAPRLWVNGFVKIRNDERSFSVTMTGDYSIRESFSHTGKLQWSPSVGLNIPIFSLPVCPFLQVFIEPGLFVNANSETSIDATFAQHYTSVFHYEWSSNNTIAMDPVFRVYTKENTASATGYVNGELSFGGYLDIGIQAFRKEAASINGHADIGLSVEGSTNLELNDNNYNNSTLLYDMLKQSYITGNWFWGTQFEARLTPLLTYSHKTPLGNKSELWRRGYVPSFSNVSFKQCLSPRTSADANLEMRGDCITPVQVGLSVRNQNNQEIAQHYATNAFQNGSYSLPHTFSGLSTDVRYTLYPMVRIGDIEMLASPSSDMDETEFPVEITDFKQTGSEYKENGFTYNGSTYSYRYDCTVTVTLKDATNVEDWGYVYCDPYGQEAFISLKSFASPYPDSRYVYYRNSSKDVVTLYPYVKLYNEERATDEARNYEVSHRSENSCPDENHPHWIDLGLPSGTLWACCNVGASAPEQYGNYYAWGETSPKDHYSNYTYVYHGDPYYYPYDPVVPHYENFTYIGSDIAGTGYDAATANWGAPWCMPSRAQIQELMNSCSSTWTSQNGVNGMRLVGPNGGTIFLPAAGSRWDSGSFVTATYWSSTYSGRPIGAYALGFESSDLFCSECQRAIGNSVRPVRSN